jgi:hypothetical protein
MRFFFPAPRSPSDPPDPRTRRSGRGGRELAREAPGRTRCRSSRVFPPIRTATGSPLRSPRRPFRFRLPSCARRSSRSPPARLREPSSGVEAGSVSRSGYRGGEPPRPEWSCFATGVAPLVRGRPWAACYRDRRPFPPGPDSRRHTRTRAAESPSALPAPALSGRKPLATAGLACLGTPISPRRDGVPRRVAGSETRFKL